jgi:hypothetical protein
MRVSVVVANGGRGQGGVMSKQIDEESFDRVMEEVDE